MSEHIPEGATHRFVSSGCFYKDGLGGDNQAALCHVGGSSSRWIFSSIFTNEAVRNSAHGLEPLKKPTKPLARQSLLRAINAYWKQQTTKDLVFEALELGLFNEQK